MARKLRFEIGDFVMYRGKNSPIGRIIKVYQVDTNSRRKWGVYSYDVDWGKNEEELSTDGWTMVDFTKGCLKYIGNNYEHLLVLYGHGQEIKLSGRKNI